MANARALDKRRKSIRNIRKITRTMELIATAQFKRATQRATAAADYSRRMSQIVADLASSGVSLEHPLLSPRRDPVQGTLLVLTANRGLCGGYNSSIARLAGIHREHLRERVSHVRLEVVGKRGIAAMKQRETTLHEAYLHFQDEPKFDDVDQLATTYLNAFTTGQLDRLDVAYTKYHSSSRQEAVTETLLPMGSLHDPKDESEPQEKGGLRTDAGYDFLPSAESILEEVVPTSFRLRLFQCFLDAAASEQVARMVAMKSATENANDIINQLSKTFNRARQSQITNEIMEIIGGVEALSK